MSTTSAMYARLAEIESEWTPSAANEPAPYIHPAQREEMERRRRQEERQQKEARDRMAKLMAQRRQYEEEYRAFIAGIIGNDANVQQLEATIEKQRATVNTLVQERAAVVSQIAGLEQSTVVDLSTVSIKDLLKTAAVREKARTAELSALIAVRDELGRRLASCHAELSEAEAALHRMKRVALHTHIDLLIEQLRQPLTVAHELFTELRRAEDAVRGLGGPRQPFSTMHMTTQLELLLERWSIECAEVKQFSEPY